MKVQFLNWVCKDVEEHDKSLKFVIFGFGRSVDGHGQPLAESICVIFRYFKPYFYFMAEDESIKLSDIRQMFESQFASLAAMFKKKPSSYVQQKSREMNLPFFNGGLMKEMDTMEETWSHIFMGKGFENFKVRRFIRVYFHSQRAFRYFQKFIPYCNKSFAIYEANINPMLKMFHDQNFSPSSWLEFDDKIMKEKTEMSKLSKANREYSVYYMCFQRKQVRVVREDNSLWFKLCSFDIECDSSHGDYPLSKKGLSKFIREFRLLLQESKKKDMQDPNYVSNLVSLINQSISDCKEQETSSPISKLYLKKRHSILKKSVLTEDGQKYNIYTSNLDSALAAAVKRLCVDKDYTKFEEFMSEILGPVHGDPIIQIGNVIEYPRGVYKKVIFCLGQTEIAGSTDTTVFSCDSEADLLHQWCSWVEEQDPDILMGYNIYNFDNEYIWNRAEELGVLEAFNKLSRIELETVKLSEMTKGTGKYFVTHGREMIDLMDFVKKNYSLDSYSLDNVSARFIRGRIHAVVGDRVNVSSRPIGLLPNDYFKIYVNNGIYEEKFEWNGKTKFKIKDVLDGAILTVDELHLDSDFIHEWCLSKDDIMPKQIFEYQKGTAQDRGLIAKYCIQDCMLCHYIFQKLEVLVNSMAMSNVCFVPFGYLFLRGQSVKIFSLIAKQCADENYRIPVLSHVNENSAEGNDPEPPHGAESYEGALVLDPQVGIYINEPVSVNDFNSLYPSCGIAENISPDTHVLDPAYMQVPGIEYNTVVFDELEYRQVVGKSGKLKKNKEAVRVGSKTCVFAVFPEGRKGILPKIWMMLLNERKVTRKRMEGEKDAFRKTLLDGLQLAFKTTANSMYGIFGFRKSPLYYQDVAASITACGRKNLLMAKEFIETQYPGSKIIYGDTDSLFVSYPSTKKQELEKIYESIDIATEAGDRVSELLKRPHNLGFEKCVSPFILMARKRYTGLYYTSKSPKKYMNTMGFALKRRDNAVIVKEIVGNAIKKILFDKDIEGSVKYVQDSIMQMLDGRYPIEKFIVTKTLRATYAFPEQISHYVLSKKMAERDPGNKPKVGDRIPFVFIKTANPDAKQTERIESPLYIGTNHCKIDYMYYLTNQLMNPLTQVYSLVYGDNTQDVVFSVLLRRAFQLHQGMSSISTFFNAEREQAPKHRLEEQTHSETGKKPKRQDAPNPMTKAAPEKKITLFFRPQPSLPS